MKVLFLDIDGVLNSKRWYDTRPDEPNYGRVSELTEMIDPDAVARLNRVIAATGCVLVLSSSWRCMDPISLIDRALRHRGLQVHLFGATPSFGNPRGGEIAAWLSQTGDVEAFAIVDDDSDMAELLSRLVQTTYDEGLLDEHAGRLIELLL